MAVVSITTSGTRQCSPELAFLSRAFQTFHIRPTSFHCKSTILQYKIKIKLKKKKYIIICYPQYDLWLVTLMNAEGKTEERLRVQRTTQGYRL